MSQRTRRAPEDRITSRNRFRRELMALPREELVARIMEADDRLADLEVRVQQTLDMLADNNGRKR